MIRSSEPVAERGLDWIRCGDEAEIVLSSRVRVARNLQGIPFPGRAGAEERAEVVERVRAAAGRTDLLDGACIWEVDSLDSVDREILVERHLISRDLLIDRRGPSSAALVLADGSSCGVMVNEEDHLRLQSLLSGLRLREGWSLVDRMDEELGQALPMAYHHEFGFLTSCPTNVGTGLRASVLMHLPGLVLTKEIGKVLQGLNQVGLTFRGLYGEGSEVVGNFFQVSNQTTLGKSEEDLVDHLDRLAHQVIDYEQQARQVLMKEAPAETEDKIWRAYGLLRYARSLSFEELINLLSGVRLGAGLKLLPGLRVYTVNKIMIYSQPAHLEQAAGRDLPPPELDAHRASFVRKLLVSEGVGASEG